MDVIIEVTQKNPVGFKTIPDDDREDILDAALKNKTVYSVYEGDSFSVDVVFSAYYLQPLDLKKVPIDVLSARSTYDFEGIGLTATPVGNNTIQISGTTSNVFPGTYFQFTMPTFNTETKEYDQKILPPDTKEDFYGLNLYVMPQPTEIELTYPVVIRVASSLAGPEQDVDDELYQWHYWQYDPTRDKIIEVVARGKN